MHSMAEVDRDAPVRFLRTVFEATLDRHIPEVVRPEQRRSAPRPYLVDPQRTVSTLAAGDERQEVRRLCQRERDRFGPPVADPWRDRRRPTPFLDAMMVLRF